MGQRIDVQKDTPLMLFSFSLKGGYIDGVRLYVNGSDPNQNSAHSSELEKLATPLCIPKEAIVGLKLVAPQMRSLPESVRKPLFKEAWLDNQKLRLRHEDYDCWQYPEVEWLAATLRTWQDSKKMDRLLMSALKQDTTLS